MTLERWLEFATRGLAPAAAERVRREYAAAFEDAQAAGEWPYEILAGWGDPHRVGRELRRVHLTEQEARVLHPGYAPTWGGLRRALGEDSGLLVGILGFGVWDALHGEVTGGRVLAVFGFLLVLTLTRWALVSRLPRMVRGRTLSHWMLQAKTGLLAMWLWGLWELREVWRNFHAPAELNLKVILPLLCFALCLCHLGTLPTALRAATKQEGETA